MLEGTAKCPICGKPYKIMPYYAGDQSACSQCVRKAEQDGELQRLLGHKRLK